MTGRTSGCLFDCAEYFRMQAKINVRPILCNYFTKTICSDKQSICWEGSGKLFAMCF
jgi:hypothetical protein